MIRKRHGFAPCKAAVSVFGATQKFPYATCESLHAQAGPGGECQHLNVRYRHDLRGYPALREVAGALLQLVAFVQHCEHRRAGRPGPIQHLAVERLQWMTGVHDEHEALRSGQAIEHARLAGVGTANECHFGHTAGGTFGKPRCPGQELCGESHHRFIIRRAPNSLDVNGPVRECRDRRGTTDMRFLKWAMLAVALLPTTANAEEPAAFEITIQVCASCHGQDGASGILPDYPNLAGQNAKSARLSIGSIPTAAAAVNSSLLPSPT